MSFASETKNELARMLPEKKCCMLADIAGFMRLAGSIRLVGGGRFEIVMMTSNLAVVRHYKTLIRNYFSVDIGIGVEQGNTLEKSSNYILSIGPEDRIFLMTAINCCLISSVPKQSSISFLITSKIITPLIF